MTIAPPATQLHKALDQEQIDLFRRRGFIIIGKLLDDVSRRLAARRIRPPLC